MYYSNIMNIFGIINIDLLDIHHLLARGKTFNIDNPGCKVLAAVIYRLTTWMLIDHHQMSPLYYY